MSDYSKLREIFEMAEILESDENDELVISAPSDLEQRTFLVTFKFNEERECIGATAE